MMTTNPVSASNRDLALCGLSLAEGAGDSGKADELRREVVARLTEKEDVVPEFTLQEMCALLSGLAAARALTTEASTAMSGSFAYQAAMRSNDEYFTHTDSEMESEAHSAVMLARELCKVSRNPPKSLLADTCSKARAQLQESPMSFSSSDLAILARALESTDRSDCASLVADELERRLSLTPLSVSLGAMASCVSSLLRLEACTPQLAYLAVRRSSVEDPAPFFPPQAT